MFDTGSPNLAAGGNSLFRLLTVFPKFDRCLGVHRPTIVHDQLLKPAIPKTGGTS
jgi:hypothetical protein